MEEEKKGGENIKPYMYKLKKEINVTYCTY